MHGFFLAGEEEMQVGGRGVDSAGGHHETYAENPAQAFLQGSGEIAHQPEGHTAEIAAGQSGHEKHDDGRKKRGADDAGQEQCAAVDLALAAAQKINYGDGGGGAQKRAQRREQGGDGWRKGQVRLRDKRENGSEGGAARDPQDVRVGEWIAKERLKACAGDRERRADDDGQKDAGEADVDDDHAVVAGDGASLAQHYVDQVQAETVEGNRYRSEFQRDDHDGEENSGENAAADEKTRDRQRTHAHSSAGRELRWAEAMGEMERGDRSGGGELGLSGLSLPASGFSTNASGWSCLAKSSIAETMRGAGRL